MGFSIFAAGNLLKSDVRAEVLGRLIVEQNSIDYPLKMFTVLGVRGNYENLFIVSSGLCFVQ